MLITQSKYYSLLSLSSVLRIFFACAKIVISIEMHEKYCGLCIRASPSAWLESMTILFKYVKFAIVTVLAPARWMILVLLQRAASFYKLIWVISAADSADNWICDVRKIIYVRFLAPFLQNTDFNSYNFHCLPIQYNAISTDWARKYSKNFV